MILKPTIFVGELAIGRDDSAFVDENLQWYIDKYEPLFYRATIGERLYNEFVDGLKSMDSTENDTVDVDEKWLELKRVTDR